MNKKSGLLEAKHLFPFLFVDEALCCRKQTF
jgi:hypothetical protein